MQNFTTTLEYIILDFSSLINEFIMIGIENVFSCCFALVALYKFPLFKYLYCVFR